MKMIKKEKEIITDADIDSPMMTGRGMTDEEAIQISKWMTDFKTKVSTKKEKSSLQKLAN
ncbi:MAG: hypothetical protein ACKVOM_09980 [Ferruginibacter sp.]